MGILHYNNKKMIVDSLISNVRGNTAILYAFASGIANSVVLDTSVKKSMSDIQHEIQFGKKIFYTDIKPVIKHKLWVSGTVYDMYDDLDVDLYDKDFYVVTPLTIPGGYRNVFKCLDNNNGGESTQMPDLYQITPFTSIDGYTWKYMYSISSADYDKFGNDQYVPVIANTTMIEFTADRTGIDSMVIDNEGVGYVATHEGIIQSVVNSTCFQIDSSASFDNDYYKDSSIYMTSGSNQMGQLLVISQSVSNGTGKWVHTETAANVSLIFSGLTEYSIQPTINIIGNGEIPAQAYPIIEDGKITDIIIIDTGLGYTSAEATVTANSIYGSNASIRPIVAPPGGHGVNPEAQLGIEGYCVSITFDGAEGNIPADNTYITMGILRDPKASSNGLLTYSSNTFNQLLKASIVSNTIFTKGEVVVGQTSNKYGKVYFANSSQIYLVGDKDFSNSEVIISDTDKVGTISINTRGDLDSKNLDILYVQSIQKVQRDPLQRETFKLMVKV